MLIKKAESIWPHLNGIICVHKPSGTSCDYVKNKIKLSLCKDLNDMETRPPEKYIEVNRTISGISLNVRPSYADNVLCVGPRYQPEDINISFPSYLSKFMSGVLVVGINGGEKISRILHKCFFSKCYHIKGILGQATDNFFSDSKVIARAKYDHVDKFLIDKILAAYQAASQRRIFEEYGLKTTSQEAYDLAVSGLFRPKQKGAIVVYSMKTVDIKPPDFSIEIQCINENEAFFKNLIHNVGVSLKCFASCSGMCRVRQGCFYAEHSLLKKHWTLENILLNMQKCSKILENNVPEAIGPTVNTVEDSVTQGVKNN